MPLKFASLLSISGIDPAEVRLLRHHNERGRAPYACWFSDKDAFEHWQSIQAAANRHRFVAPFWASFVKAPGGSTMFVGMYAAQRMGAAPPDTPDFLRGGTISRECDQYHLTPRVELSELAGRLFIEWDPGMNWVRRADRGTYAVAEIRRAGEEPPYPGHAALMLAVSEVETLPPSWVAVLRSIKGVYLVSCARTKEQYVGAALGDGGFHARWTQHAAREGDAAAFRSREPSDYRVSILEVAGSFSTDRDIEDMERRWKSKLQSREMGLNKN